MQVSKAKAHEPAQQQKDAYIRKLEARLLNQHKAPGRKLRPGSENSKVATGTPYDKQRDTSCACDIILDGMAMSHLKAHILKLLSPSCPSNGCQLEHQHQARLDGVHAGSTASLSMQASA